MSVFKSFIVGQNIIITVLVARVDGKGMSIDECQVQPDYEWRETVI